MLKPKNVIGKKLVFGGDWEASSEKVELELAWHM